MKKSRRGQKSEVSQRADARPEKTDAGRQMPDARLEKKEESWWAEGANNGGKD